MAHLDVVVATIKVETTTEASRALDRSVAGTARGEGAIVAAAHVHGGTTTRLIERPVADRSRRGYAVGRREIAPRLSLGSGIEGTIDQQERGHVAVHREHPTDRK